MIRRHRKANPVQRLHRRARLRRIQWFGAVALLFVVGGFLLLGATDIAAVRSVRVIGSDEELSRRIDDIVQQWLHEPWFVVLSRQRVARFSDSDALTAAILQEIPVVRRASVSFREDAALEVRFDKREPSGIWCKEDTCRFWDDEGVFWGQTVPSTGPLLLLVRDERNDDERTAELISGIRTILQRSRELGMRIRSVILSSAEPGGARAATDRGYTLYLDMFGDVEDQFDTLAVLLADRANDPAFSPVYIDLRTPGRVYYQ